MARSRPPRLATLNAARRSQERHSPSGALPSATFRRRQTRVLTWRGMATCFGFLAQPRHDTSFYQRLLAFAAQVRRDTRHLGPRDLIDIQSFIWIQGSEEYE